MKPENFNTLPKHKIYERTDTSYVNLIKFDAGVIFGHDEDKPKEMKIAIIGEAGFEDFLNDFMSAFHHFLKDADKQTQGKLKKEIYNRAVQAFSFLMDAFYPDASKLKYGILNDHDLKEAEDRKINEAYKRIKERNQKQS